MTTYQRSRGQPALVWPQSEKVDLRGNRTISVDMDAEPIKVKAAFIPDRSSRAEIPGQVEVNAYIMIVDANLKGVGLWSRVQWNDSLWDVSAPPAYHHGTRHVRHWTVNIRQRPDLDLDTGQIQETLNG